MKLDALVFGAHPDDAEIGMGGTIAKMVAGGLKIGIIDLTKAELSTRGNVKTRKQETNNASEILMLAVRENLEMPDGRLEINDEYLKMIIWKIRQYKPEIVFAPYKNDRHPDHITASAMIKKASFLAGLANYSTSDETEMQEAFRPKKIFYFMQSYKFEPKFIVDISDFFDIKMKSVFAYKTQFYNPESNEPNTYISDPKFVSYLEARSRFYGFQIGKQYGEPFYTEEDLELDIVNMVKSIR